MILCYILKRLIPKQRRTDVFAHNQFLLIDMFQFSRQERFGVSVMALGYALWKPSHNVTEGPTPIVDLKRPALTDGSWSRGTKR